LRRAATPGSAPRSYGRETRGGRLKVAFAQEWLRALCESNAALQSSAGSDWQALATLLVLIRSAQRLSGLIGLPAIDVLVVSAAGTAGQVVIRQREVELFAQPADAIGRIVPVTMEDSLRSASRLVLFQVVVRGAALSQSRTA